MSPCGTPLSMLNCVSNDIDQAAHPPTDDEEAKQVTYENLSLPSERLCDPDHLAKPSCFNGALSLKQTADQAMVDAHVTADPVEASGQRTDGDNAEHVYAVVLREPTGRLDTSSLPFTITITHNLTDEEMESLAQRYLAQTPPRA